MKPLFRRFPGGLFNRIFVGHPSGIDAIHVDAAVVVIGRSGASHHIERCFSHVRVGILRSFPPSIELAFDGRHVNNMLIALRCAQRQRLKPRIENKRSHRVDQLHFE